MAHARKKCELYGEDCLVERHVSVGLLAFTLQISMRRCTAYGRIIIIDDDKIKASTLTYARG